MKIQINRKSESVKAPVAKGLYYEKQSSEILTTHDTRIENKREKRLQGSAIAGEIKNIAPRIYPRQPACSKGRQRDSGIVYSQLSTLPTEET